MSTAIIVSFLTFIVSSFTFNFLKETKLKCGNHFKKMIEMSKQNNMDIDELYKIPLRHILLNIVIAFTVVGSAIALVLLSFLQLFFLIF